MSAIAAISTPQAVGGVSMVRISGDNAFDIAAKVFNPVNGKDIHGMKGYTACYGNITDGGEMLDDGVLLVFRAPHSYTGEDVCEITCHGGIYITRKVLQACINAGAEPAEAGEFTKRALLNGKMSLTQAEAVIDVINAQSKQYLDCSNAQREGSLYRRIEEISQHILDITVQIAAWIDYPDEMLDSFESSSHLGQLENCRCQLQCLLESYDIGKVLREGVPTAIVGKPNVGKSTLMNLLVGSERSIVTDIAGTTRDIVEETVMLGGAVLRIADCAGLRETEDVVEGIGVEMMLKKLEQASLVLAVFDSSRPLDRDDYTLLEKLKGKQCICVINKADLEQKLDMPFLASQFSTAVEISANDPGSLKKLNDVVEKTLDLDRLDMSAGFIANERQRKCAEEAEKALQQAIDGIQIGVTLDATGVMLEKALDSLMQLSGKSVSETVIDEVFKRFCVGK